MDKETKKQFRKIDKQFEAIDKRFEAIDKRFESIDKRFESIDKRFEAIDKRFESIDKRLDQFAKYLIGMEERIEERIMTRIKSYFDETLQRMDVMIAEVRDSREERTLQGEQFSRLNDRISNHEGRIVVLERKFYK